MPNGNIRGKIQYKTGAPKSWRLSLYVAAAPALNKHPPPSSVLLSPAVTGSGPTGPDCLDDGLANLVGQICQVSHVAVINPTEENKSFSFGFFNVASTDDVQKAISKLDGYVLKGRTLRVNMATPRDSRGPPTSGFGSLSPRESARESPINNDSTQNRPVTPRTLENRYGNTKSKSPSPPRESQRSGCKQSRAQNGTQSSGDEAKIRSPKMIPPMVVIRKMHAEKIEVTKTEEHKISCSPSNPSGSSKGRGQALQSAISGKPQHVRLTHNVSSKQLNKKHLKSETSDQTALDAEIEPKSGVASQVCKMTDEGKKMPFLGRGRALETMLKSRYQSLEGEDHNAKDLDKSEPTEIQYVLQDERMKVKNLGMLEESGKERACFRTLLPTPDSIGRPKDDVAQVHQYVLQDEHMKVKNLGMLEESGKENTCFRTLLPTPDSVGRPKDDVAQVHVKKSRPSGLFREMPPDVYPYQEGNIPGPNRYGPYPPPWVGNYYGYLNPEVPMMNCWGRPTELAPRYGIAMYDYPPMRYTSPRQFRPTRNPYRTGSRFVHVPYKQRPYETCRDYQSLPYNKYRPSLYSRHHEYGGSFANRPRGAQIRELSRCPRSNQTKMQKHPTMPTSLNNNVEKNVNDLVPSGKSSQDTRDVTVTMDTENAKDATQASSLKNSPNVSSTQVPKTDQAKPSLPDEASTPAEVAAEVQKKVVASMSNKLEGKSDNEGTKIASDDAKKLAVECSKLNAKKTSTDMVVQPRDPNSSTKTSSSQKEVKVEKSKPRPCINCGELGLSKCSKCKVTYCTRECQSKHWATHKLECKAIASGEMVKSSQSPQTSAPQPIVKTTSPGSHMFASKPAYTPNPQASVVYGRFLSKDTPVEAPEKQHMTVLITSVESPECLYGQLIQASSVRGYCSLQEQMSSTYATVPTAKELHFYLSQVGELCAAEKEGKWHRAEILTMNNPEQGVDVMLVDFGIREHLPRNSLRKLKGEMVKFPKLGVKCFLSGICSPEKDGGWSPKAAALLRSRICQKECRVEFKGQDDKRGYKINLFASMDASTVSVSEELISAHLAKPMEPPSLSPTQQAPQTNQSYTTGSPTSVLDNISEGSKICIQLGYIASMDIIYGNLAENSQILMELQKMLNQPGVIDQSDSACFYPEVGQIIAACYTDSHWYRARVNNITTPEKCSVIFVDYGNREEVAIKDCHKLPIHLQKQLPQAVCLVLAGVQQPQSGWPNNIEMAFRKWICEGDVEAMVVRKHRDYLEVELFSPSSPEPQMSFNHVLADAGFTHAPQGASNRPPQEDMLRSQARTNESCALLTAMVVWVIDPANFYVQFAQNSNVIMSQQAKLLSHYGNSNNDNYVPTVGDICAALYSDKCWYRAKMVESMSPVSTKLFFMDFGNEDVIENDDIRPLSAGFREMPAMAELCGLDLLVSPDDPGGLWSEKAIGYMRHLVHEKVCVLSVKRIVDNKRYVNLEHQGKDVGQELVRGKLAVVGQATTASIKRPSSQPPSVQPPQVIPAQILPRKMPSGGNFKAVIIWVNNPTDIYLQIYVKESVEVFQQLELDLTTHYEPLEPSQYQPQTGDVCVAKSPEHGMWLRARVVAVTAPNCCKVHYCDYGNEEDVTGNIQPIEEPFREFPAMAVQCSLAGVSPSTGSQWNPEATAFLKHEVMNQLCDVCIVSQPNCISIFKDGVDIAETLIAMGLAKTASERAASQPSVFLKKTPTLVASESPASTLKTKPVATPAEAVPQPAPMAPAPPTTSGVRIDTIRPPTQEFTTVATHINNPSDMYIQIYIPEHVQALQELDPALLSYCESMGPSKMRPVVGDMCIAKCSDGSWYRARVVEVDGTAIKVHYVDYGNEEVVNSANVHPMLEQFAKLPAMAVHCSLADVCPPGRGKSWNKEAIIYVQNKMLNKSLLGKVIETSGSTYTIDFVIPQGNEPPISVSKELINTGLAKNPAQLSPPRKVQQPGAASYQDSFKGRIISSPNKENIQQPRPAPHPNASSRGSIINSPPNKEKIQQPRPAPHPDASSRGSIVNSPPNKDKIQQPRPAPHQVASNISTQPNKQEQRSYVGEKFLKSPPVVSSVPLRAKLTIAPAKPPGTEFEARVSIVNSPSDFYVALQAATKENKEAMQKLKCELTEYYGNMPLSGYKPELGEVVSATRKGMWGRAKVVECNEETATVLFVDYGIQEVLEYDKIREIEARFTQLPMMALHCSLAELVSPGNKPWKQETINTVREKICGCKCQVFVKSLSPDGIHSVELLVTMKNDLPLQVREEMIKYGLGFPANKQPIKSQQRKLPDINKQPIKSHEITPSNHSNQSPSNRGAFQTYQKTQPPKPQDGSPNTSVARSVASVQRQNQRVSQPKVPLVAQSNAFPPKANLPTSQEFKALVIWFNSPASFYVHVYNQETGALMEKVGQCISSCYANAGRSSYKAVVGELVVANFKGEWFRAVVQGVSANSAEVLYLDYGNQETVESAGIHKMNDELRNLPLMAIHCSLAGVAPSVGKVWSAETVQFIKPKVLNHLCDVHIIDSSSDKVCVVTLRMPDDKGMPSVDLKEELIKRGLAVESTLPHTERSSDHHSSNRGLAIKFPDLEVDNHTGSKTERSDNPSLTLGGQSTRDLPKLVLASYEFQAIVVVVNNPGSFFVHVASEANARAITKLGLDLNSYYSQAGMKSFKPMQGELCVAQFSQDNGWYRAKAIEKVSSGAMKVLFVDFGNEEEVHFDVIRELSEVFRKVTVMAQHCCLAGILPCEDQGGIWSSEVTKYMKSKVMEGFSNVKVVEPSSDPIRVELVFRTQGPNPTNLAEELIKKNMARRHPPTQMGTPHGPPASKPPERTPPLNASVRPKQSSPDSAKKAITPQIMEAQLPNGCFKAAIAWVTNPCDMFIQVASNETAALLGEIASELPKCYGNAGPSKHRPVTGSGCVALYQETGDWCRAVALEYVARDQIKVRFVDYGNTDIVSSANVHKLDDRFITGIPALAGHCSLSGVKPVGTQWSKEATLLISKCINTLCDVKVTGKREGSPSVLVEITPEADQPSLNHQLITMGLAQAVHEVEPAQPVPTTNGLLQTSTTPAVNGVRSLSRASNESNGSDVEAVNSRLSEQDRQIKMQQRALEEQKRQILELQKLMSTLQMKADK